MVGPIVVRIEREDLLELRHRLVVAAREIEDAAQVVAHARGKRIQNERLAAFRDRGIEPTERRE
jgi:hypothetical protein